MGLSSKKQKTATQTQTSDTFNNTSTSTPNVPDWLLNPAQSLTGGVTSLMQQGAGAYTPGESALQKQANAGAAGLTTSPYFGQAADQLNGINYTPQQVGTSFTTPTVKAASLLDGLDNYISPYTDDVVNTTLAGFDKKAGETQAAQAAQAAGTGAFRGSRYGIREGETAADLAMNRAQTEAQLRDQAFTTGAGLSNQDADRRQAASVTNAGLIDSNQARTLQAQTTNAGLTQSAVGQQQAGAGLLSGLGTAAGADARANVGTQASLGSAQTDLENAIKQYPLQYQTILEGLFAGMNPSDFIGHTTNSSGTSSGTSNGTSTTTQSQSVGSIFGDLLNSFAAGLGKGVGAGV